MPLLNFFGSLLNSGKPEVKQNVLDQPIMNNYESFLFIRKVLFKITQPYYKDMVKKANINTLLTNNLLAYNQKIKMYTERMLLHYYLQLGENIMTKSFKQYTAKLVKQILAQEELCTDHYDIYWLMIDMLARDVYHRYIDELDSFVEPTCPFTKKRKREDEYLEDVCDKQGKEKISKH